MSGLLNDFTEDTRALFIFNYRCWETGKSLPLELHHIYGRCSNSPLNAAPLSREAHELGDIHSPEKRAKYINKTLKYLERQNYKMDDKDISFLKQVKL